MLKEMKLAEDIVRYVDSIKDWKGYDYTGKRSESDVEQYQLLSIDENSNLSREIYDYIKE